MIVLNTVQQWAVQTDGLDEKAWDKWNPRLISTFVLVFTFQQLIEINFFRRNTYLEEHFPQLDEELYSTQLVNDCLLYGMIFLGIVMPVFQITLIKLHNDYGQYWPRVAHLQDDGFKLFDVYHLLSWFQGESI